MMLNFNLMEVVSSLKVNVKPLRESTGADVLYTNDKTATATIEHILPPHPLLSEELWRVGDTERQAKR